VQLYSGSCSQKEQLFKIQIEKPLIYERLYKKHVHIYTTTFKQIVRYGRRDDDCLQKLKT